jgi:sterol 3beta-glucosyltransferase
MLITILTAGSRGDIQPYIALGKQLRESGLSVRVATFRNYETFVKSHGLEFHPIRGDVSMVASSESARDARQADNPLKILLSFNQLKLFVFDLQKDFFDACTGSDAIVYHPGVPIGYFIAEYLKIPSILATPFPMTPTRAYPALIFYNSVRLRAQFNLVTHKIFEQIMWSASSSPIKQFWKKQFGHLPENFACPYSKQNTSNLPTIISCSNYVFPRPRDWSEHVHNTGYWFLDEEVNWEPSSDLLDFLRKGTPPVYVGFGSIGDSASAIQTTRLVIQALKRSGQRGILVTGWNGMSKIEHIPDEILILESAPHSWLFPRMTAVVHHGGAGTTAAGLRAGVPGIVIPHSNDQFAWGRRVYELGAGSKPVPRKNLTAEKLSEAINFVLAKEVKDTAKDLGTKIQSEKGAEAAAKVIINVLNGTDVIL